MLSVINEWPGRVEGEVIINYWEFIIKESLKSRRNKKEKAVNPSAASTPTNLSSTLVINELKIIILLPRRTSLTFN